MAWDKPHGKDPRFLAASGLVANQKAAHLGNDRNEL